MRAFLRSLKAKKPFGYYNVRIRRRYGLTLIGTVKWHSSNLLRARWTDGSVRLDYAATAAHPQTPPDDFALCIMSERRDNSEWGFLYLRSWPFQIVPDETFWRIWADRARVRRQLDRLFWRWSRLNRSTFHLIWADLGAGKTHTLMYIRQWCLEHSDLKILSVYAVMPKQIRTFLEVYQAVMAGLDLDVFAEMFSRAYRAAGNKKAVAAELFPAIPDAAQGLNVIHTDPERRPLAIEWLRGTRGLTRRHLDSLGVTRYVRTTDDAVGILGGLIRLVQVTQRYNRVVIMIDECQRIGLFRLSIGRDINTGLQTWYDSNPNHLTLVLSFGSGEERYVRQLLSPELQNREDNVHLSIPLLSATEAIQFVGDLLREFRLGDPPSDWFPFIQSTVEGVVGHIVGEEGITPRALMKVFDSILTEIAFRFEHENQVDMEPGEAQRLADEALGKLANEA
jgi:hypothetical protein